MADLIPVIKGTMGSKEYYLGIMTFQDLAAKTSFFHEIKPDPQLNEMLQRQITKRSEEMVKYLLKQKERFYGSLIIAAFGGNPEFIKVKMQDHVLLNDDFNYGLLKFNSKQKYFALDGQHRLASIKKAIEANARLRTEEVSVIILTHEDTEEGNIKTRRLFHTLNRYAKPTTTGENIALDEDNVVSIVTRTLLGDFNIFSEDLLEHKNKNISKSVKNNKKFTSLAALYSFNFQILDAIYKFDKEYLKFRPSSEDVEEKYEVLRTLWGEMIAKFDFLQDIENGVYEAIHYREPESKPGDGNIIFRPLGLEIFGKLIALAYAEKHGNDSIKMGSKEFRELLKRVENLPFNLNELPWKGTIFINNKIQTGFKELATKLASYMLNLGKTSKDELLKEYRGHLGDESAHLPKKLVS